MRSFQLGFAFLFLFSTFSFSQEKPGTPLWRALGTMVENKKEECDETEKTFQMPRNSLDDPSDGMTPTGKRLQPFGQPNYWGREAPPAEEDTIAVLPPIPDLRTPDQITKTEQKRNFRNAKFAVRRAELLAKQEERALEEALENMPPPDPSTAMFQVESQAGSPEANRKDLPDSPTGGKLKPFGPGSTYIEDGEVKFRGGKDMPSQVVVEVEEDPIAELPPLPDLRTPDQVTKVDQKRNMRINKFASRRIREEEFRNSEMFGSEEIKIDHPDPSTALIQVESQRKSAVDMGRRERPETIKGSMLKPFNKGSSYVENGELKYQHSNHQFVESPQAQMTEDDELAILPPLPDLRTPDQVTKAERRRNLLLQKFRNRQAREEAQRQREPGEPFRAFP